MYTSRDKSVASVDTSRQKSTASVESSRCKTVILFTNHPGRACFVAMMRTKSCPTDRIVKLRSSMRVFSLDESLHAHDINRSRSSVCSTVESSGTVSVVFKDIRIREYERSVGDNPSCSSGPPIGLGWKYREFKSIPLDRFESCRAPRRSQVEMRIPREKRQDMLLQEWDIPKHQLAYAVRETMKAKSQRRRTIDNLNLEKLDAVIESAKRKFIRTVTFKRRPSKLYQELIVQADKAAESIANVVASHHGMQDFVPKRRHSDPIIAQEDDYENQRFSARNSVDGSDRYQIKPNLIPAG